MLQGYFLNQSFGNNATLNSVNSTNANNAQAQKKEGEGNGDPSPALKYKKSGESKNQAAFLS